MKWLQYRSRKRQSKQHHGLLLLYMFYPYMKIMSNKYSTNKSIAVLESVFPRFKQILEFSKYSTNYFSVNFLAKYPFLFFQTVSLSLSLLMPFNPLLFGQFPHRNQIQEVL